MCRVASIKDLQPKADGAVKGPVKSCFPVLVLFAVVFGPAHKQNPDTAHALTQHTIQLKYI